jgi:hypothetical protein
VGVIEVWVGNVQDVLRPCEPGEGDVVCLSAPTKVWAWVGRVCVAGSTCRIHLEGSLVGAG